MRVDEDMSDSRMLVLNGEYYKLVEWTDSDTYIKGDTLLLLGRTFNVIELGGQAAKNDIHTIGGRIMCLLLTEKVIW